MPVTKTLLPKLLGRLPRLSWAVLSDVLSMAGEVPPRGLPWLPKTGRLWNSSGPREPAHVGDCGPRIHAIDPATGQLAIDFRLYLPPAYGTHVQIRGRFTRQQWHDMESTPGDESLWRYAAEHVLPGSPYEFRFWGHDGNWREVTDPMAYAYTKQFDDATRRFDHYAVVPDLDYASEVPRLFPDAALVIFACTFPGLLTHWEGGHYFPQHATCRPLAERVRCSGVIARLREDGYNAILLPIQTSAADLFRDPWRESDLVGGPGAIDPQIGDWSEVKAVVDEFHRQGLIVIPDLVLSRIPLDMSMRGIDQLYDPTAGRLWFDPRAGRDHHHGTRMLNLRDQQIRAHLIEMLIRFVRELDLAAFRLADADEWVEQYAAEETNYGWLLLQELHATLAAYEQPVLCLCGSSHQPPAPPGLELIPARYQPAIGLAAVDTLLQRPADGPISWPGHPVAGAMDGATDAADPRLGRDHKLDPTDGRGDQGAPEPSGPSLTQLVLNQAQQLLRAGELRPTEVLDFVACRTAMLEALTMFAGPAAYVTRAGCSDYLRLDSHDESGGWQAIWSVEDHPDVETWATRTTLTAAAVRRRIGEHADLMRRLRKLFVARTSLGPRGQRSLVQVTRLDEHPGTSRAILARHDPTHPERDLLLACNFALAGLPWVSVPLSEPLHGPWRPLLTIPGGVPRAGSVVSPVVQSGDRGAFVELTLPAHSMLILGY
jgi:hypothetical protein